MDGQYQSTIYILNGVLLTVKLEAERLPQLLCRLKDIRMTKILLHQDMGFESFHPLSRLQEKSQESLAKHRRCYTTDIDPQQQKVIVTGNDEAETLIKKLIRNGRRGCKQR
ncbi:hypothetical protein FXO38_12252 [Capsicum annuum]|nr:hypothetical protein FXO38_12252 [Capsicum annuum]KAF3661156.1 hypothetical protein FXO37_13057 [Capsicum annuum]